MNAGYGVWGYTISSKIFHILHYTSIKKSHKSNHGDICRKPIVICMVAEPGFEPGLTAPKAAVLPLHNSALQMVPKVGLEPTRGSPPISF